MSAQEMKSILKKELGIETEDEFRRACEEDDGIDISIFSGSDIKEMAS